MFSTQVEPLRSITSALRVLDLLKHPDGSKKHPALTCKDLHMSHPTLENGKEHTRGSLCIFYWLFVW